MPKQQPKFKKNTMIELLEKENDFKPGRRVNKAKDAKYSPGRRLIDDKRHGNQNQWPNDVDSAELREADKNIANDSKPYGRRNEPLDTLKNRNGQDHNKSGYSANKRDTSPVDPKKQQEHEVDEPVDDLDDSGLLVDKQIRQYMPDEQDPRRQMKSSPRLPTNNPNEQGSNQYPLSLL